MRKFNIAWTLLLVAAVAMGAKITDNILNVGDGNSANDKEIRMTDGRIKWDAGSSKLQFSNDAGVGFKDLGTGGGGGAAGVNILGVDDNADFEATALAPWTNSGGTFIVESGTPGFDLQSGSWDSNGAAQNITSSLKSVPLGLENRSCNATIQYKVAGSAGDLKFQVIDSGAAVIAEKDLDPTTDWKKDALQFTCPASESIRIRILSVDSDPALLLIDNVTLGKTDFVDISQTALAAVIRFPATAGCTPSVDSATFVDFSVVAACPAPIVDFSTQAVDASDVDQLIAVFPTLTPGAYRVTFRTQFAHDTANTRIAFRLRDNFGNFGPEHQETQSTSGETVTLVAVAVFTYTTAKTNATFVIQGAEGGTNAVNILNDDGGILGARESVFYIEKFPLTDAEAITIETIGEHWNVNIGGANPSLGNLAKTDYTEITNGSLEMTINPGSKTAQIPCLSGTNSTGLTCSVDESLGIVIDISTVGTYKACFTYTHQMNLAASSGISSNFQLIETPNDGVTTTQLGKVRTSSVFSTGTATGVSAVPHDGHCSEFIFTSVGQHTIRLMFEQSITGTVGNNILFADEDVNEGQRDINITVRNLDQQQPTPAFTDLKASLARAWQHDDANEQELFSAKLDCKVGPLVLNEKGGDWITSIARSALGICTIVYNFTAIAADDVHCQCTIFTGAGDGRMCNITATAHTTTGTGFKIFTDSGAAADDNAFLECKRRKQ